jgi:hypothetical protein
MLAPAMRAALRRSAAGSKVALSVAAVAVAYAATLALLDRRAFWTIDSASKLLQVQAILASGYRDFSLPWPGRAIDPEYRWNPLPHPFGVVEDGRLFSFYPPAFAVLSSIPYRLFGMAGLLALPFLASIALAAGVARTARTLGADAAGQAAAVLATGLCTPVWFYSVVFWEHVPAAALAVWGVAGALDFVRGGARRDLVRGCVLATLAVYLRDELYLFCGVLAAVAVLGGPGPRARVAATALATLAATALPLWAFQAWALGHPLGFHLDTQFAADLGAHLRERWAVVHVLFLAGAPGRGSSLALMGPFALWLLLAPRLTARAASRAVPVAAAFAALGCAVSLAGYAEGPIRWMMASNGLLATAPVLVFAGFRFADPREASLDPRAAGALRAVALGYAALYALLAPLDASTGVHWGNRLLLVLYPLLAVLAGPNLARWLRLCARTRPAAVVAVGLAVALGLGAQAFSIHLLREKLAFSVRLAEAVRRHPDAPIATGIFWVPQELFAEFYARPVFLVGSQADLRELRVRLVRAGYRELLFATAPGRANAGALVERVDDPELGFYGVDLVRLELP